jgi:hypothetical protein
MSKSKKIKLKKCPICKSEFTPWNSTQRVDKPECAIIFNRQKDAAKEKKADIIRKKAFQTGDIKLRKKAAQSAFNAFIRKRDQDEGCISCDKNKFWSGQWHAGHFKTVGARSDLRFNEDNCHKQCSVCNNHLSGNIGEYTPRLIEKIGRGRFDDLMLEQSKKYTCEHYKEIETLYKNKFKQLVS